METFEFTIMLTGVDLATNDLEDRIVAAGCDDALLCFCGETPYLEFERQADTAETAIRTALAELSKVGLQTVLHPGPDHNPPEESLPAHPKVTK